MPSSKPAPPPVKRVKPNRAPTAGPTPWTSRFLSLPNDVITCTIATLLTRCVKANEELRPGTKGVITRFHAKEPPPLVIEAYLSRLVHYIPCPRDALLLMLVYLNRIARLSPSPPYESSPSIGLLLRSPATQKLEPEPRSEHDPLQPMVNSFTIHRLLLSTLLVACKSECDGQLSQARVAKVGGVSMRELIRLEVDILALLSWKLTYSLDQVEEVSHELWSLAVDQDLIPEKILLEAIMSFGIATTIPTRLGSEQALSLDSKPHYPNVSIPSPPLRNFSDAASDVSSSTSTSVSPCLLSPAREATTSPTPPSSYSTSKRTSIDDERDGDAGSSVTLNDMTPPTSKGNQGTMTSRPSTETIRGLENLAVA